MKTLFYSLCLAALVGCNQQKQEVKSTKFAAISPSATPKAPVIKEIALNGLDYAQADVMVRRYIRSYHSANPVASFWFNEDFLDAMNIVLKNEGADGVRIYFAKDSRDSLALVMVSTRPNGTTSIGKPSHKDYFNHSTTLLDASYAKGTPAYAAVKGAGLYTLSRNAPGCPPRSPHYLAAGLAATWARKFRDDQPAGNPPLRIRTSNVWYHADLFGEIKTYLNEAKAKALPADGFRIYVVRKDDRDQTVSLVIVPTYADATDPAVHHDYYDCLNKKSSVRAPSDNGKECPSWCEDDPSWPKPDSTITAAHH